MVPVVLKRQDKLKIILKRIGEYITGKDAPEEIGYRRKMKIWQDWISGGKYFYFLMESAYIDAHNSLSIWFYPKNPDLWHLMIKKRAAIGYQEKYETVLDFDYLGHEEEALAAILKLPVWWKIIDGIDNMCQTRIKQNPKYRTIQHEYALRGELEDSETSKLFLDKYYNPEEKKKHDLWKARQEQKN